MSVPPASEDAKGDLTAEEHDFMLKPKCHHELVDNPYDDRDPFGYYVMSPRIGRPCPVCGYYRFIPVLPLGDHRECRRLHNRGDEFFRGKCKD